MSDVSAPSNSTPAASTEAPKTQSASSTSGAAPSGQHQSPIERELASKAGGSPQEAAPKDPTATKEPATKPEPQDKPKYKLKVNGKEVEHDIDTILRKAQLAESAESKFQEAASTRKQLEQFMDVLQSNPLSVLTHPELGINFEEIATQYLTDKMRRETMDPKDLELEELRKFKEKQEMTQKQRAEQERKQREEQEFESMKQQAQQEYDRKISEVLQKSGLPKAPRTVKRIAEVLYTAHTKGYELDAATAVDMVREDYLSDIQELVSGLEGDGLLSILGGDVAKKIQKHNIAMLQAKLNPTATQQPAPQEQQQTQPRQPQPKPSSEKLRPDEWKEMIRRKAGL